MITSTIDERPAQRFAALTAGLSLVIMAVAAMLTYGIAHGTLVVQGDPGATWDNLISSQMLFRAEVLGWVMILICDVVAAWALYLFLKPIHEGLSLLGSWLRLTYAALLGIAVLNLLYVMLLTSTAVSSSGNSDQLQAQVTLYLEGFGSMWSVGLIMFGGHLLFVGWLACKSDIIPKVIGILLIIAGIGYMAVHLCSTFLPQFMGLASALELVFIVPMIAGELGFALWLLFKGGKVPVKARGMASQDRVEPVS
jgi:hypothetical protein